jgi:cellulose synthase/poly-beta-1,6-N-acetylglucosamine synthase-like glycosyltransferase
MCSLALVVFAFILALLVGVFFLEVLSAIAFPLRDDEIPPSNRPRQRVAVLIPAHNESTEVLPTLADVKAQMHGPDRILVVADNCSDDTAAVAATAGVDVVSRNDPDRCGKGYALAFGLGHLASDPPEIVVLLDADCRLGNAVIDRLAASCAAMRRPVQALYLMTASQEIDCRVGEFAFRVKNLVRPLGLKALGLPCQLMGSGIAIPWDLITSIDLASSSLVEDLKLGLEFALAKAPPVFCPSAAVVSSFPSSSEGTSTQRRRWEQGHIDMIVTGAPRLVALGIARENWALLAMALDLAIPPLSLLAVLVVAMSIVTSFGPSPAAMLLSLTTLAVLAVTVFLSWLGWGRDILPPSKLSLIGPYVIRKLPSYWQILVRAKVPAKWIRADRGSRAPLSPMEKQPAQLRR